MILSTVEGEERAGLNLRNALPIWEELVVVFKCIFSFIFLSGSNVRYATREMFCFSPYSVVGNESNDYTRVQNLHYYLSALVRSRSENTWNNFGGHTASGLRHCVTANKGTTQLDHQGPRSFLTQIVLRQH